MMTIKEQRKIPMTRLCNVSTAYDAARYERKMNKTKDSFVENMRG